MDRQFGGWFVALAMIGCGKTSRSCEPAVAGCGLVSIPGATYVMGPRSEAQPSISVDSFTIDQYEVTVARFRRFVEAGRPSVPGGSVEYPSGALAWSGTTDGYPDSTMQSGCNWTPQSSDREPLPMNCVDWMTAQAFCVWDGGRLPTEAEWELAARGPSGRPFPWGTAATINLVDAPNLCDQPGGCEAGDPAFAGGRSPEGVWYLADNVSEWTADRYQGLDDRECWGSAPRTNPLCQVLIPDLPLRVYRGGSYSNRYGDVLIFGRVGQIDRIQLSDVGFRCAR